MDLKKQKLLLFVTNLCQKLQNIKVITNKMNRQRLQLAIFLKNRKNKRGLKESFKLEMRSKTYRKIQI